MYMMVIHTRQFVCGAPSTDVEDQRGEQPKLMNLSAFSHLGQRSKLQEKRERKRERDDVTQWRKIIKEGINEILSPSLWMLWRFGRVQQQQTQMHIIRPQCCLMTDWAGAGALRLTMYVMTRNWTLLQLSPAGLSPVIWELCNAVA